MTDDDDDDDEKIILPIMEALISQAPQSLKQGSNIEEAPTFIKEDEKVQAIIAEDKRGEEDNEDKAVEKRENNSSNQALISQARHNH